MYRSQGRRCVRKAHGGGCDDDDDNNNHCNDDMAIYTIWLHFLYSVNSKKRKTWSLYSSLSQFCSRFFLCVYKYFGNSGGMNVTGSGGVEWNRNRMDGKRKQEWSLLSFGCMKDDWKICGSFKRHRRQGMSIRG